MSIIYFVYRSLYNQNVHRIYNIILYLPPISDLKTRRHRWAVNKWQRCITLMNNHSLVLEQLSKNALENLAVEEPSKEDQRGQDDHKEPCSAADRNYDADAWM